MIETILPDLSQIHVLVVGDVMIDQYWFGAVERISPEAPVPIVRVNERDRRGGGAANVALNVVKLGAKCTLLSVVGDDHNGSELEKMLESFGVNVVFVRGEDYETTVKQRVISRNQQLIRLDFEQRPDNHLLAQCYSKYQQLTSEVDAIIFSDYGKGCLEQVRDMISHAREKNIFVSVDPKGRNYSRYQNASLITPNLSEFEQVVGEVDDDVQMDTRAHALVKHLNIGQLLVTLSERGMKLYKHDDSMYYSPARAREVYDVSGAGDTVIACIGTLLAANIDVESTLEIANAAASVVVAKLGTAVAELSEIETAVRRIREDL